MAHRRICRSRADKLVSGEFLPHQVNGVDVKTGGSIHNVASRKIEEHMVTTAIRRRPHHVEIDSEPDPVLIRLELTASHVAQDTAARREPLADVIRKVIGAIV